MNDYFFIKDHTRFVKINTDDILYIEGSKNYVNIFTGKRKWLMLCTMTQMEDILPAHAFCRVHRSYIIALNKICAFDKSMVYMEDKIIPIGNQYKDCLQGKVMIIPGNLRGVLTCQSVQPHITQLGR